ncbi:multicopper oxidase family protein [Hyalangium gracile]|uniref:multicopper oxidase family protein n=1 Tax=Hyalangium gracile TaxID=394092 RepID=UPI001CCDE9D0|nr:multicopper oxidase domain-containing protein [Hyalangium gracile]
MSPFSRRTLLKVGTGLAASLSLPNLTACSGDDSEPTTLTVDFTTLTLGDRQVRLRTYNGALGGPTIYTRPGAKLRINIDNKLPEYDSSAWKNLSGVSHTVMMNIPHDLNTTNLHVHGLEVIPHLFEPVGTSDPSSHMIAIKPGEKKEYTFEMPDDHPTGLYWYHPHHHGSTSVQVANGLAGLIVVEGAIDEVKEIAAARQQLIAIQDVGLFESKSQPGLWSYDPPQNAIYSTDTGTSSFKDAQGNTLGPADSGFTTGDFPLRIFLNNGSPIYEEKHNPEAVTKPKGMQLSVPRYQMRPGEVVRFRMLNGCTDNMIPLVVEQHTMYLLAMDGVNFPAPRERQYVNNTTFGQQQVLLAPGGRAEFLIKGAKEPGVYRIMQLAQTQQFLESQAKVLAEIEISGEPMDMALPTSLPLPKRHYPLIKPDEVKRTRDISFDMHYPPQKNLLVGLDFAINGQLYDETAIPVEVELDTVEEWVIHDNGHHAGGSGEGHPFHIHTNSFEVISVGDEMMEPGTIQDTVWVPHNTEVRIRIKFKQWSGKDVFHCHIIPHEDAGMMQNVLMKK